MFNEISSCFLEQAWFRDREIQRGENEKWSPPRVRTFFGRYLRHTHGSGKRKNSVATTLFSLHSHSLSVRSASCAASRTHALTFYWYLWIYCVFIGVISLKTRERRRTEDVVRTMCSYTYTVFCFVNNFRRLALFPSLFLLLLRDIYFNFYKNLTEEVAGKSRKNYSASSSPRNLRK